MTAFRTLITIKRSKAKGWGIISALDLLHHIHPNLARLIIAYQRKLVWHKSALDFSIGILVNLKTKVLNGVYSIYVL